MANDVLIKETNPYFNKNNTDKFPSLEYYIYDLLCNKLGMKYKRNGTQYLLFYLEYAVKKYAIRNNCNVYDCNLTKDVYPIIAQKFGKTSRGVERNIQNVVTALWPSISDEIKKTIFLIIPNKRPTNMEIICSLYDYISRNYLNQFKNEVQQQENNQQLIQDTIDERQDLHNYIYELICNKLSMKYSLKGSKYLLYYLEYTIKNNHNIYAESPTNSIYPTIARKFNTIPEIVDRSIIHAIEDSWPFIDAEIKKQIFPIVSERRPTNTELMYALYEYIQRNYLMNQAQNMALDDKYNLQKKNNLGSILYFELPKMLEESFGLYSRFDAIRFHMLIDVIMIVMEMGGVTETEMIYIVLKISKKYGLDYDILETNDRYIKKDYVTPLLYRMCKHIYTKNPIDFPEPVDNTYIKTYLNTLTNQAKSRYLD